MGSPSTGSCSGRNYAIGGNGIVPSRTDTSQSCDADHYAVLKPSAEDSAEYLACMNGGMQFWQAGRGIPLRSRWNDEWEFVIDTSFRHPKGIGDLGEMNRLIAVRARGYEVLKPLIGQPRRS
jgi:hypothetical protein